MATLRIADLRAAVTRILDASERQLGSEIDLQSLPFRYRWELAPREIFNVDSDPGARLLGDLEEDLDEMLDLDRDRRRRRSPGMTSATSSDRCSFSRY
jgi:hypothetical protein